jgi:hypothetical protein
VAMRRTQTAAKFGWWFLSPLFVMASLDSRNVLRTHLVFQPIWEWGDLGSVQLPQSNSSTEGAWNPGVLYLAPHADNSIQLLSVANNYNGLPYLVSSVWPAQFQKPDATDVWKSFTVRAKQN